MPDVSLASLALRLAVSMGVVIGLMVLAARLLRRAQAYAAASGGGRRGRVVRTPVEVTAVAPLARGASVALVRTAGRLLVLGITEQQVTLLHDDRDADRADPDDRDALTEVFSAALPPHPSSSSSPGTARIAAPVPTDPAGGLSAWTDALETLRARTVRR